MNERPILSIFIATYNRKEILLDKIRSLLDIKSDDFNVLVLDDMSTDGTVDARWRYAKLVSPSRNVRRTVCVSFE